MRRRLLLLCAASAIVGVGDSWALGSDGTWAPVPGPPIGYRSAIYDPVRERVVALGDDGTKMRVWALSVRGTPKWYEIATTGPAPSVREGESVLYDPGADRLVLFGGDSNRTRLNDVWALPLSGIAQWNRIAETADPPPARGGQVAAYDSRRREMLIFGGGSSGQLLNDVWALSLEGDSKWRHIGTQGTAPDPRAGSTTLGVMPW